MDYSNYINCIVKINLSSGYYYLGKVLDVDESKIKILDKNKKIVILDMRSILTCEEVQNNDN